MTIDSLHDAAMIIADEADLLRRQRRFDDARARYLAAFEMERAAADLLANHLHLEPSRAVIHRSAATLAVEAGRPKEAEQLICRALLGNPPSEIADELRSLWDEVNFRRHLDIRGMELVQAELVLSLWGEGVGFGFAPTRLVNNRIQHAERMLLRSAERLQKLPYRDSSDVRKEIRDTFGIWQSVSRAASYAVVLRVGGSQKQEALPFGLKAEDVVTEVMACVEIINDADYKALERRIPQEEYRRNFVGLCRQISPRGKKVSSVGLASMVNGNRKELRVGEIQPNFQEPELPLFDLNADDTEQLMIHGILLAADSTLMKTGVIQVQGEAGHLQSVKVPKGLMSDVVRPFFERSVVIQASRTKGQITLQSISGVSEDE